MRSRRIGLALLLAAMSVVVCAGGEDGDSTEAWRQAYEAKLRGPDGWLSVAGLFFLKPGANTVGSDASNDIVLPRDAAPLVPASCASPPTGSPSNPRPAHIRL